MENPDVKIDISKRYNNKFRLFYPSRNLIKYTTNIGGVLVGSRAIRCYTIDGNSSYRTNWQTTLFVPWCKVTNDFGLLNLRNYFNTFASISLRCATSDFKESI